MKHIEIRKSSTLLLKINNLVISLKHIVDEKDSDIELDLSLAMKVKKYTDMGNKKFVALLQNME
jgi:hypothetical protein